MLRLIGILGLITLLSLGLAWVGDEPGRVSIDWADYHMETSILVIVALVGITAFASMLIYYVFFMLIRSPRLWMRSRHAKQQTLGLAALTDAFAAIATQDARSARRYINKAQHYLPQQPLTLMLSAQVARMEGNEPQARIYLEQMLQSEGTEFLALRGLIENARRTHDDKAAMQYAQKAIVLKPQDVWLITLLTGLYSQTEQTQQAVQLLEVSARKRYIPKQEQRRLHAYVLYENARGLIEKQRLEFAVAILEDVLAKLPSFTPASAALADIYMRQEEYKQALAAITKSWKILPHPLLTQALIHCYDAQTDHRKVIYAVEKLAQVHPEQHESQFLMATFAIKRNEYTSARGYLKHLMESMETIRACRMMAELENADGNANEAARWLDRAGVALPDPTWVCSQCDEHTEQWHFTCPRCASVATMQWK